MTARVFVYGTLTDPAVRERVLGSGSGSAGHGSGVDAGPATLVGLARAEGDYPTLVPPGAPATDADDPDGADDPAVPTVDGRLLRVGDAGLAALDAYERVADGLYVRVSLPFEDGTVETYVGAPERLGVAADWPGSGPLARRVRRYVDDHGVRVRPA